MDVDGEHAGPPRHPTTPKEWSRQRSSWGEAVPEPPRKQPVPPSSAVIQMWTAYAALFVIGVFIQQSQNTGNYDGVTSFIAAPIAVVIAIVVPALTLGAVALPGLVIRLVPKLRGWWIAHAEIGAVGVILGVGLIAVSYFAGSYDSGEIDGSVYAVWVPDWSLLASSWSTFAFFASHTWIPERWRPRKRKGPVPLGGGYGDH